MDFINKDNFEAIVAFAIFIAFVGWVLAAFIFGRWQGVSAALKASRENIVALNSVEGELFKRVDPGAISLVRGGGLGLLSLLAALPAVDKEAIERAKDVFSVVTDGKPNTPPEPPAVG